ncbi:hypothetical protein L7F22_039786 [Adiantum nelumboides]|nr:hypothetical protein [Adiantum nelumboides]
MGAKPLFALLPANLGEVEKVQVVNKMHLAGSTVGTYDALMASSSSVADDSLDVDVALEEQEGLDCEISLEKLDLRVLNDLLSKFFLVVCKRGGGLFSVDTLMGMLRSFGTIVKKEQDLRIVGSGISKFSVRGGLELYKLERAMFSCGSDELGPFVRFCERLSKNYKVDLNHFQPEYFRSPITVRDGDVLVTYNQLMRHMPAVVEGLVQSEKSLSSLVKSIGSKSGVAGNFSNKSLRNTCVTCMSLGQVPREVGMLVIGHKWVSSYEKYDMSREVFMAAAQDILSQPYDVREAKELCTCSGTEIQSIDKSGSSDFASSSGKENVGIVLESNCGPSKSGGMAQSASHNGGRKPVVLIVCGLGKANNEQVLESRGARLESSVGGNNGPHKVGGIAQSAAIHSNAQKVPVSGVSGVYVLPYKVGNNIPFDENLLNELPFESARALGIASQSVPAGGVSIFPVCNMSNCVVNVYVGKDDIPFEK